ncbi:MAG TPA: c-type cytochrome, partial [Chryseolinea sp.]
MINGVEKKSGLITVPFFQTFRVFIFISLLVFFLFGCDSKTFHGYRPMDPWAFRSVLDKKPRMLTLALDSNLFLSYDLARCTVYKAWKGGVTLEGAPYTDKKNVQPTSWGKSYFTDSLGRFQWVVRVAGKEIFPKAISKGYSFERNQITLLYELVFSGDTILVNERPEFVRSENGKPGLERVFKISNVPDGMVISLKSSDSTFTLNDNETVVRHYYQPLPSSRPPKLEAEYDHRGRYFIEKSDCLTCHELDKKTVGPSFIEIAARYPSEKTAVQYLIRKVRDGGTGAWGNIAMNPHPNLAENEIKTMVDYILALRPSTDSSDGQLQQTKVEEKQNLKPGFGAPLESLHPSYVVSTLHNKNFKPRVGGLAFLPDGRLLVTTWDTSGSVYALSNVETGDSSKIVVKRIASGLAEPLGIEVVDGEIYVLQKQELTHLVDNDGDDVTDVYESVCNSWGVTADFHEFAFGLVYKDGYFYATLSMAM